MAPYAVAELVDNQGGLGPPKFFEKNDFFLKYLK